MNRILLALLSAGIFGCIAFWITAWVLMLAEKRWPSNDLTGEGLPSGCFLLIVFISTLIGAIIGFRLSWGDV